MTRTTSCDGHNNSYHKLKAGNVLQRTCGILLHFLLVARQDE